MAKPQLASSAEPLRFAGQQQFRAANPESSAWVDASAGSGKTKVLIDRVLRLLLAGVPAQRILCLTFTKAAAANMAVRLTSELGRWATLKDEDLSRKLYDLTETTPQPDQLAQARRLFAATLDTPGGLQFQTIHGFCQSLLARFPLEANVPVGFTVLEDRQSKAVLAEARRALLQDITDHPQSELATALTTLLEIFTGSDFAELEREIIGHRGILEAQLGHGPGLALEKLNTLLDIKDGEDEAQALARFCRDDWHDTGTLQRMAQAMLQEGSPNNRKYGQPIANWLAKDAAGRAMANFLDEYIGCFLTSEGEPRKLCSKKVRDANPDFCSAIEREQDICLQFLARRRLLRTAHASRALILYAASLLSRYHQLKLGRLALDFDDLITAACRLVTTERASWVLYKLDGGIEHILVDEAQDTNDRQWQLIEALTDDFFSGASTRDYAPPRSVFAVGDYKQSIYSFQGADPNAFTGARQRLAERLDALKRPLETVSFNVSFRSTSAVLAAVDHVFFGNTAKAGLLDYREHMSVQPDLPGQVEVWPVAPPDAAGSGNPLHPSTRLAQHLAAQIRYWIETKETLPARGRAMEYGDILVLVHRRGRFMPEFVRACKQAGVPVSGADRMIIDDQLAVQDLIAFASFLLLPEDDLTLATVLKGPLIGMSEDELFALAYDRQGASLLSRLGKDPKGRTYAEWLAGWQKRTDRVTPYTLLSALLVESCPQDERSGRRAILRRLGPEANDPLDELLSLALQYEQGETPSLQGFLRWLKSGQTEIKRELEQASGQVRIMTAHGSKGLEAPVVIVATGTDYPNDKNRLLVDPEGKDPPLLAPHRGDEADIAKARRLAQRQREREEYHRLLYVALTRAEDRLIFAAWSRKNATLDELGRLTNTTPANPAWYHLLLEGLPGSAEHEFDFTAIGGWKGMGLLYKSGEPGKHREEKRRAGETHVTATLPDWALRLPPDEPSPTRPLTPSRVEEEPATLSPLEDGDASRFRRGLLMHRLLQTLPDLPPEQRRQAGLSWLGRQIANPDQLLNEVLAVIDHPDYAVLFGPNSRAEVPVSGQVGKRTLSGQIDRLAVTADTVWLVDYKTNRQRPDTVEQTDPAYLRQLAAYRAALQPLYPAHRLRAILLWTNGPELMEVPENLLKSHAP